jgi:hypothetical protein
MKNKMLAIFMAGLIIATVFGAMSASAAVISKKQEVKKVSPLGAEETGDIAAFVFNITITEIRISIFHIYRKTEIQFIPDATVTCIDKNGDTHIMEYVNLSPEKSFYAAYDVPVGECEITTSKEGYVDTTINGWVVADQFKGYMIEIKKVGEKHRVISRMLDLFPSLIRTLLKL